MVKRCFRMLSFSLCEVYFYNERNSMLLLSIPEFFHHLIKDPESVFEPEKLIRYGGLFVLFLIVYAQTGIFFCFFLPGDALIFAAGVLIASGDFRQNLG